MYSLLRSFLFKLDAEQAHRVALSLLRCTPSWSVPEPNSNPVRALGMDFNHPIGLAAGFDKNGAYLPALTKLGFSHIEVGTVTPRPQAGNPKPRLFRVQDQKAIVNRMGFNNAGVEVLVAHIQRSNYKGILGINIGKNKDTLLSKAAEDYCYCMRRVYSYASYITINISSPNTPDLRQLQQKHYFSSLLARLNDEQKSLADAHQRHVPLVVKISPDEAPEVLKEMTEQMLARGVEGIIATNTTAQRGYFSNLPSFMQQGGLSGKPLTSLSTDCLRLLKHYVGNKITLIGVGGIDDVASAQEKLDAGASLLQLYTGLVYQGPHLVSKLLKGVVVASKTR
jgi:dihydroorotate dehydrogenase